MDIATVLHVLLTVVHVIVCFILILVVLLQTGKRDVRLLNIEPVGNYAIKLSFDDGHETGIYSWTYLHELCTRRVALWSEYLQKLQAAGASRDQEVEPFSGSCDAGAQAQQ